MDFERLHQCFSHHLFDDPIVEEFLYKWLSRKVAYLARQEATLFDSKLYNADFEEIKSELIMLILKKIKLINPGRPFRSWTCQAIRYLARNMIRKKKPELVDPTEERSVLMDKPDAKGSPFNTLQLEKLEEVLQTLKPEWYAAVILRYYYGLSVQETAKRLSCKPSQIEQRCFKAKEKLKERLSKYFPEYSIK